MGFSVAEKDYQRQALPRAQCGEENAPQWDNHRQSGVVLILLWVWLWLETLERFNFRRSVTREATDITEVVLMMYCLGCEK